MKVDTTRDFEVSGRAENAVEARSTGVEPPTTSTTSVEASTTPMEASTTATEASVEVAGSLCTYGMFNVPLLTRTLPLLPLKIPWKRWSLHDASCNLCKLQRKYYWKLPRK